MPAKKPENEDQRFERVRQENRRGIIDMPRQQYQSIGRDRVQEVWNYIDLQIFKTWEENEDMSLMYYGYCPLFEPLKISEEIPTYSIRVTFEEPEMLVELFKRRIE